MRLKSMLLLVVLSLCSLTAQNSCTNLCVQTAAQRGSAKLLLDDAQLSLSQASEVVRLMPDGATKDDANMYLEAAKSALRDSVKLLKISDDGCSAPNTQAVFSAFVEAWRMLEPFLMKMGGDHSELRVPRPIVVGEAK